MVSYSADLVSTIGFSVATLAPLVIRLFVAGDSLSVAMGMAIALYLGFMILSGRIANRHISDNIVLRLEASSREKDIRASENRYRLLLRHSPVGIFHYDNNLIITYCNDNFANILKSSVGRIVGLDMSTLKDQSVLPSLKNALNGEISLYEGHYHATLSDANVWIAMTCAPSRDDNEKVIGGIAIVQDITERKLSEISLIQESEKNRALLQGASDGMHILNIDGNVIEASDSFCAMLGYQRDEMIGMNVSQWDAKLSRTEITQKISQLFAQRERTRFETLNRRKDGTIFDVEVSGFPLELDGKPVLFNTSRDITERKQAEKTLQNSEQRLRTIIETEPECIKVVDGRGRLLEMNAAGLAMLEADSLKEAQQQSLLNYIDPEYQAAFLSLHRRVMNGESGTLEFKIKGLRGTARYLETHATPMRDSSGDITLLLGITRDITESKNAEVELRIAATSFESQEGMFITDANSVILKVNKAFTTITGYTAEEVIGKNPRLLSSGRHDAAFYDAMWKKLHSTGAWEGEIWNRRKNGEIYPEHLTITAVKNEIGRISNYVATLTDITMSKKAADEIKYLAFYDPLTHLPNRRLLLDRLQQALASSGRSGKQGALLFIDLDNFKTLNDTLGHDIGDILLQQVAQRLESCVREGDTVARLGGDEFVVMLEDLSEHSIDAASHTEAIGNKILATLNQPYRLGIHAHHSTSSIGATLFNKQNSTDELMKQADIAMYQAKKAGRNTLRFFDQDMQLLIDARMSLEAELRKAIDGSQFHLYYQIQVDHTLRPLGAEALIRWIHPERGLISPAEFIPIAEEMGLIHPIGWWVLKTACAQLKAWQDDPQTCNLVLSVNVSAKQFHKADFAEQVKTAMQLYDVNPTLLKLELTEGMLLENIEATIATMFELRDIGVGFSLDDFGTGYSSLQYLKRLPLTQLKIDQSFVRDIPFDKSDRAIVSTIIAMAHSLNLDVIAEGVETEEQQEILQRNGCNHYQGYLFGKPVPIEQFEKMLKRDSDTFRPVDHTAMMLRLNWHKSYDCGEPTIDHEHRKLFDLANSLIESAFTRNENPKGFDYAMEELFAHVVKHFADEEAILALRHYADLDDHKAAHKVLTNHAIQLRDAAAEGGVTIGELVNFIAGDVVAQHMLKEDRKFYSLFNAVRIS